jgi:hypothetical protein
MMPQLLYKCSIADRAERCGSSPAPLSAFAECEEAVKLYRALVK